MEINHKLIISFLNLQLRDGSAVPRIIQFLTRMAAMLRYGKQNARQRIKCETKPDIRQKKKKIIVQIQGTDLNNRIN